MPGQAPDRGSTVIRAATQEPGTISAGRKMWRKALLLGSSALSGGLLVAGAALAASQIASVADSPVTTAAVGGGLFNGTEVVMLAVFGGAMSFAILSASWLIRERSRVVGESEALKRRLADLRATHERMEALVNVGDQRIVVWKGADERPALLGSLSKASGAPADRAEFLAFGRWLTPDSAISFEGAVKRLRTRAEAFDLPLVTRNGVVEAQGRTSGGHAFVRFIELTGERSTLARLEAEHARLLATFDSIQSLFERLSMPVWLRDIAGELFWANSAYARAVDCESGERAVSERMQLLDSAERNEVARRQREGGVFCGTLPATVAGDRRTLDVTEVRSHAGYAGIAVDRTELEKLSARLKHIQMTHAQTLDHLPTAVAMFDERQQLQFSNASFQKLFALGSSFLESQPTNAQLLDALRAAGKLPESPDWRKWREAQLEIYSALDAREDHWRLPDGRTLRVVVNPHSHGGATWLFDNVTEQLELKTNYNALMRIQGETLENLSEAVAVFGSDGRLRLCNPAFGNIWGAEPGAYNTGAHISALSQQFRDRLADAAQWDPIGEAVTGFDDERGDKSGRLETVDGKVIDYALVRLPEGQTMLALVDMTAAVNVERALKERNEALEQADHLKNRFLQHVSIELRAPLTSISGFSELLATPNIGKLNPTQADYVGYIFSASQTLKAIIDDLLDLATVDAGAMTLDLERIELSALLEECLADLAEPVARHGLKVAVKLAPQAGQVTADRQRLKQILSNLLSNAVTFSPDGGAVRIESLLKDGLVEIAISDEGPGVPEQFRETIFGRFESRSNGDRRRGAGLGLSIVKSFVELHGGTVRAEAATDRGARFVCSFPQSPRLSRQAA